MAATVLTQEEEKIEDQKQLSRHEVWKMFDRIAGRYDLLNRLLSFGRDSLWRRKMATLLGPATDQNILDLATGTAEVPLSLIVNSGKVSRAVGLDMSEEMLRIGQKKIISHSLESSLSLIRGNAENIPLAENSFEAVTIAFGIRNVTSVPLALGEMKRVLKSGGKVLILEFSLPANRLLLMLYLFYFRKILPIVGSIISGDSYAYRYLNKTVETFPYGQKFCDLMSQAGFEKVAAHPMTFGVATIYTGDKAKDGTAV